MIARQDEFERVAMPHTQGLLRVARRITPDRAAAEDLVQETLLRAWRSFDRFQSGTNARAWLFRILFNAYYTQGRKLRAGPVLVSLHQPGSEREPQRGAAPSLLDAAAVTRAIEELSTEHRAVFLLGAVEGFTCREMAEILALPIGTVMSRLSRARQALRERLGPAAPNFTRPEHSAQCATKEAS
ncbi:MAG: sigma-70 family RNA polymerase sigma factor [Candidatus Acidiferrales bacterium]